MLTKLLSAGQQVAPGREDMEDIRQCTRPLLRLRMVCCQKEECRRPSQ